eukprot:1161363-Pelagomonas_calceolata.AAC.8
MPLCRVNIFHEPQATRAHLGQCCKVNHWACRSGGVGGAMVVQPSFSSAMKGSLLLSKFCYCRAAVLEPT